MHLRAWPGLMSCSHIKSILQNYPALLYLQEFWCLWHQLGCQWLTVVNSPNDKQSQKLFLNEIFTVLYNNMKIILSSWKRHSQRNKTSMYRSTQANTGQLHVGELRAIAFFSVICGGSDSKASAYNAGDLISGMGRSPGEGNSNPLQYSCLEKALK